MRPVMFERPVRILVGLGMPRDVDNAFQAYAFLSDLPADRHVSHGRVARQACLAAIDGSGDAALARQAFVDYAERASLLVDEAEPAVRPANEAGAANLRLAG